MNRILMHGATALLLSCGTYSAAQTWPQQPLRLVVPFTAGGPADVVARFMDIALPRDERRQARALLESPV